jgi:D-inositol-3-phosphate glycosyltransferase
MRIAMVSEHASPLAALGGVDAGGQNVYVAALATALGRRGHDVTVYTRRDHPVPPGRRGAAEEPVPLAPGVEVVHVPVGPAAALPKDALLEWMPDFGRWLAARWEADPATRPHVVHAHFWMSGVAATVAAGLLGGPAAGRPPVLETFHALGAVKRRHQGPADTSPARRVQVERSLAGAVDAVIATCRDEVDELAAAGARPRSVFVVPCGVDLDTFTPAGPAAGPRVRRGQRLLSVGRLVPRKGVDTAVAALVDLPGSHLAIAGGPPAAALDADPEARRLRALAQRLGVADRVHLLGSVPHDRLPDLLRWTDAVIATPWYEPFGIVPLEAMACGRPVIGSAVGGLLDTVVPGETGTLVPPRDPAALAAAVADLLADDAGRARMGRAARRRALAHYGWDDVAAAVESAYLDVVAPADLLAVEV